MRGESGFDTTKRPIRLSGHDARADAGLFDTPSHLFLRTQRRHHLSRPNPVLSDLRSPGSTRQSARKSTMYKMAHAASYMDRLILRNCVQHFE